MKEEGQEARSQLCTQPCVWDAQCWVEEQNRLASSMTQWCIPRALQALCCCWSYYWNCWAGRAQPGMWGSPLACDSLDHLHPEGWCLVLGPSMEGPQVTLTPCHLETYKVQLSPMQGETVCSDQRAFLSSCSSQPHILTPCNRDLSLTSLVSGPGSHLGIWNLLTCPLFRETSATQAVSVLCLAYFTAGTNAFLVTLPAEKSRSGRSAKYTFWWFLRRCNL